MTQETTSLYEDIHALLEEAPGGEEGAFLARLEHTLTDGYARALVLEAERVRLERRMDELTDGLRDDPADAPTDELATVARRLSDADTELSSLRGTLARLRARARAIRAA
jgi:ABC-type phosphate transport system auxiliary subunit